MLVMSKANSKICKIKTAFSTLFLRKRMMLVNEMVQGMLYTDPQAAPITGFCEVCGGALYGAGTFCIRCERRRP